MAISDDRQVIENDDGPEMVFATSGHRMDHRFNGTRRAAKHTPSGAPRSVARDEKGYGIIDTHKSGF